MSGSNVGDYEVRNIQPTGRDGQRRNHDYIEKTRIVERSGSYHQPNTAADIITPHPSNKLAYMDERDRFQTDFASEHRQEREEKRARQEEIRQVKCNRQIDRETKHWEDVIKREEESEKISSTHASKKNDSGIAYNPITLEYRDSLDGDRQKYSDDMKSYRAELRKQQLYGNTNKSGYDPVTGQPLRFSNLPEPDKPNMAPRLSDAVSRGQAKL
ncbi:hypothetical protein BLNAU_143 [Blattamonas nauphoetae]|uniref:Uncharacterized protein n=1 Tax=Blattamonas nauphoetae TaxID=2049346 RepID=A0ABQ9YM57_9EUKA|nr:hypothetical protein BLNAU_143 [Blattamonas nauphoetae]